MKYAIAFILGCAMATCACSYLGDHPPQICVTADQLPDGGVYGDSGNPGY